MNELEIAEKLAASSRTADTRVLTESQIYEQLAVARDKLGPIFRTLKDMHRGTMKMEREMVETGSFLNQLKRDVKETGASKTVQNEVEEAWRRFVKLDIQMEDIDTALLESLNALGHATRVMQ